MNVLVAAANIYMTYKNNHTYRVLRSYYLNKYDDYCSCAFDASLEDIQIKLEIDAGNKDLIPWEEFNKHKIDSCRQMAKEYEIILHQLK